MVTWTTKEPHRLFKLLKSHMVTWDELTNEQIDILRIYYPFLFNSLLNQKD